MTTTFNCLLGLCLAAWAAGAAPAQTAPDQLLLKDYRPRSIYNLPQTRVEKARYPVIDVHSHTYARTEADIERWVRTMDEVGLEKTVILSGATGSRFDEVVAKYGKYPGRFDVWCGIDWRGIDQPGFGPAAVAELERCKQVGARGVGEILDKGRGLGGAPKVHLDDPRLDPIWEKCAELGLPINIHVGEDQWMYEPMDEHNDGLMNAYTWRIRQESGVLGHEAVLATLENAVKKHARTVFVACHFANCCADLNKLGALFDRYPNLYADIGARFGEIAPIPRFMAKFFAQYQDRLLYGTDNGIDAEMYRTSFRLLETQDEHFYPAVFSHYHWPWHGFGLPELVLRKVYRENAARVLGKGL